MNEISLNGVPMDWREVHIKKENKPGEYRKLTVPNEKLRKIQKDILQDLYTVPELKPTSFAYGFVPDKNTLACVQQHSRKADFYCMDVKDFFDTFPVNLVKEAAIRGGLDTGYVDTLLTACSYNNTIPQGSPTSPCLTNIGMYDVDCMLAAFAKGLGMTYTRYADDIFMSIDWQSQGIKERNIKVYVFKSVDKLLSEKQGQHLKWSKCHVIHHGSRDKPQILGIIIRADGKGYNAPRKLRRLARCRCCNLARKLEKQHGRPTDADWREWRELKGTVEYCDYVRSGSDEDVAGADPFIQEKYWNYLLGVFKCQK